MFGQTQTFYEFGPFRVDTRERQLLRDGEIVPLRPKVFDTLLVLVENCGHILTKDEVMKRVWSNTAVEEGNIARTISSLRTALGEDPRQHRYIETIPWRGYRFVAKVTQFHDSTPVHPIRSIAVLPFENVDADTQTEYLSDGMTESLIATLARLTNVRVTSRNSVFHYKGERIVPQTVGRKLNVDALLMGRVTTSHDVLSISVELVETSEDRHLWGGQFVRNRAELVSLDETIVRKIAAKVRLELAGSEQPVIAHRHPRSDDAYVCYLKGRYHFNKLTLDGVQKAIEYLQQAIEQDPHYALAYAALADCHNYLAKRDEAKTAVLKALELDETLGEARASLGFWRFLYEWDFAGSEREFERALTLSPNYAEAHHWYAIYLANLGRHDRADEEATRAIQLDPLSLLMNMTPALNYYLAREYDKAGAQLQKVLEMDPNFVAARSVLGNVLVQQELYDDAIAHYEIVLEAVKGGPVGAAVKGLMARAFAKNGNTNDALRLLQEVIAVEGFSTYLVAGIYAALGDFDKAFESLDKSYEQHDVHLVSLKLDPMFDPLRSDPRFKKLVTNVGIPQ
jgi:DNA-binding winged helix-turn-helix (wHTH) protein/Tfp pilus assembly protein PilF